MLWAEILLSSSSSTFLTINSVSDWVRTLRGRSLCFAVLLPGKESRPYVLLEGLAHSSICLGCSSSYSKIKTNLDQGRTHTTCAPWTFGGEHEGKLWCSTKSAKHIDIKILFLMCVYTWDSHFLGPLRWGFMWKVAAIMDSALRAADQIMQRSTRG